MFLIDSVSEGGNFFMKRMNPVGLGIFISLGGHMYLIFRQGMSGH